MSETVPINFLLVDDLAENLLALEALLQREGLVCLKARSGEEALELLLIHDVALALLDVQMPGMDGFQLAEFMRGSERARHIPIIFVTAGTTDAQRRFRGYETGAVDFIQKPIEADILRSKANVFFDLHQQHRQILAQRDELAANADALRTVDRNKNEFLAVLGHELRNPVMALGAGLHLLNRHDDPVKALEIRRQMERQVVHLSRIVDDLLDISRIDQGKIELRKERVDLQTVLAFAVEASQPQIEANRHTLTTDILAEQTWLDADPTRVAQVVSNLLNNAAKYTPEGGQIGLVARVADGFAEIEVSDNGIGIPEEMRSKIFDLFAQVKSPVTRAQEGLGIGLALVKQLVELHGGTISLKSSGLNVGSSFQVRLPVVG
ncbi:MAG: hybrid sensor histidine kinase/response regulator [Alphaproteobacteria bacterium]|nr:hybrid sensor histidine kinase/response regulator [Alphaproteobacteria bacterium]MBU1517200.1 hybrid sensor histidine kinase/response regulator [Alphaproteobacteria bacterium]MBU2093264.1 hybrid sensor histidine kinase/response regulator [Alphaproteobacteria bacterium]MBU2150059.1 hybrid sensor histidine kinase/response regulator [Alphaproteobacteria bacterium]MBU2307816.1 hybrid sensor histidine kinase/response regulator [Alphaproteobacteria bacterium]